jgi:cyclophilin family peptidyl-prolyl cis-trans isomerase/HEAT repeat protein
VLLVAQAAGQIVRTPTNAPQRRLTQQEFAQNEQAASGEPWQVLFPEKEWAGSDVLVPLLSSTDPLVRHAAALAVGRLEDPRTVAALLATNDSIAPLAVVQALHGFDPADNPDLYARAHGALTGLPAAMLQQQTEDQVRSVERPARTTAEMTSGDVFQAATYRQAIVTLEWLARTGQRAAALEQETLTVLTKSIARESANDLDPAIRKHAFTALVNGGVVDPESEKFALADQDWSIRRLAIVALAGSGAGFDDSARVSAILAALTDASPIVRYEALRAYLKHGVQANGCQPIVDRLNDEDTHVSLAAIDALGDHCTDDQDITTRILAETTTPTSNWHRPAHAFLALAKRAPDKAEMSMEAFETHPIWWVRMYAARAAAAMKDVPHLDKLAYDVNDNVREATLVPLRRLKHGDADVAIAAALNSGDVQLLRTAAMLLKGSPPSPDLFRPLMTALTRLTTEGKETSRDGRLALLDAIEVHIQENQSSELGPLLKDFDPKVAARAAALLTKLTGKAAVAAPAPYHRGWPAEFNHARDKCVTVDMASGGRFVLDMDWSAPITADRFLRLAVKDHYYDGLTFHRVEPNFVIQGGSPGANEYAGNKEYMRDEISPLASHVRGTVGLSTRGRNTADGQFFVNLVDNSRLDLSYTIFANVRDSDMAVIDRIEEGAEIRTISPGCSKK